jgi:hypothetical protein
LARPPWPIRPKPDPVQDPPAVEDDRAAGITGSDLYHLDVILPVAGTLTLDARMARRDIKHSADDTNTTVTRVTHALSGAAPCGLCMII